MNPKSIVGKVAYVNSYGEYIWQDFWGVIARFDGDYYWLSGGAFTNEMPFTRKEITVFKNQSEWTLRLGQTSK